jgi:hypothetical protein
MLLMTSLLPRLAFNIILTAGKAKTNDNDSKLPN